MITKAYIVEKQDNLYRVRIPLFHGLEGTANYTPNNELPFASVCIPLQVTNPYNVGDIVYVGFEDNNTAEPIILGLLYLEEPRDNITTLTLQNLKVNNQTTLNENTTIGNTSANDISLLQNARENIQAQIDILNNKE